MSLRVGPRPGRAGLWITGTVKPAGAATGERIRQRAGSATLALAREEAAAIEARILRDHHHGARGAVRTFGDAVLSYLKHEPRSASTKAFLRRLLRELRHLPLDAVNQETLDRARDTVLRPGAAPGTVKRNLVVPVRAVLLHASRRGWCQRPAFDVPREPRGRTAVLLPFQVEAMILEGGHIAPLLTFLIGTGCRVGEATGLDWSSVDLQAGRALLHEDETKANRRRVVALPPAVVVAMASLTHRDGIVFQPMRRRLEDGVVMPYRSAGALRKLWDTVVAAASLPAGTTPHVLRHTWASWHYAIHRDLLLLAREGGWASTALVERYAHLMPSGHEPAIKRIWGIAGTKQTPAVPKQRARG